MTDAPETISLRHEGKPVEYICADLFDAQVKKVGDIAETLHGVHVELTVELEARAWPI
jgi:hypothetical protein